MPIDYEPTISVTDVNDEVWFDIINRTITPQNQTSIVDVLVQRDSNSRNFGFHIQRYFEDEDLSTKRIRIHYVNSLNQHDMVSAHSIEVIEGMDVVSFKWKISDKVCWENGNVSFAIEFHNDDETYRWFTKPTMISVVQGLCGDGEFIEPDSDWFTEYSTRMNILETKIEELIAGGGTGGTGGANGKDGVSITSVKQTTTSSVDGGNNIITVTLSNGNTSTFAVKNGSKGSKGDKGDTGDKGDKGDKGEKGADGSDYVLTSADKEEIAELVNGDVGIPDYWKSALEIGVDNIRQAMEGAGRNKSAFLFYSDAHWTGNAKKSPMLLKYLRQYTPINKTIFGGDVVDAESSTSSEMAYLYDSWRNAIRDLPNHHSVVGNHDDGNEINNRFGEDFVYSFLLAPEETNDRVDGDGFYYYIDDKCEKTRYLYLDTAYQDAYILSETQAQFVINSLKSTPANYHIVVIAHAWFNQNYDNYPVVTVSGLTTTTTKLMELFEAYNNRLSGELKPLGNASQSNDASVAYDFKSAVGKIEFCIGGHWHNDYAHTESAIPVILCEADTRHNRNGSVSTLNTINEQSVTAVVANYNTKKVSFTRVGRGNSFEIDLNSSVLVAYYSITNNLTNVLSSSTVAQLAEGDSFNTTLTAKSGELKSVVVTMGGVDVTADVYDANSGTISIANVTGNIVITAIAEGDEPVTPTYTNVLDTVGYKEGYRLSTSSGNESVNANTDITGFIPCKGADRIYLKNVTMPDTTENYYAVVCHYKSDKSYIDGYPYHSGMTSSFVGEMTYDEDGNLTKFRLDSDSDIAFIRICVQNIDSTSIITVNEPIE